MDEQIKELLRSDLKVQLRELADMEVGTPERTKVLSDIVKTCNLLMASEENDNDILLKQKQQTLDEAVKKMEAKSKNKLEQVTVLINFLRIVVDVAGIVLPLIFYGVWMSRGLKFEETGTFTSTTFRGLFNKFRPAK